MFLFVIHRSLLFSTTPGTQIKTITMHRNGVVSTSAALSPKQQHPPRASSPSGFLHHHQHQHPTFRFHYSHHHHQQLHRKAVSSSVTKASNSSPSPSEHVVVPAGVEFPGSYLATGKFGRGLFSNGSSQDVPLTSTPLNVCACVPEDVMLKHPWVTLKMSHHTPLGK